MDRGQSQGVSAIKGMSWKGMGMNMKKIIQWTAVFFLLVMIANVPCFPVYASGESAIHMDELLGDAKEKLESALSQMDDETVSAVFAFIKEKVQDGSLKSEEGIKEAVSEGKEKFGVDISEADAKKIVETMEKLEDLGFSGEYVIDKAQELYDRYGADFLNHADEVIGGAVQNAVAGATESFFHNLWESAKNFFKNLFSGL